MSIVKMLFGVWVSLTIMIHFHSIARSKVGRNLLGSHLLLKCSLCILIHFQTHSFLLPPPSSYFHTNFFLYVFVNRDRAGCKGEYFGLYEHAFVFLSLVSLFPACNEKSKKAFNHLFRFLSYEPHVNSKYVGFFFNP